MPLCAAWVPHRRGRVGTATPTSPQSWPRCPAAALAGSGQPELSAAQCRLAGSAEQEQPHVAAGVGDTITAAGPCLLWTQWKTGLLASQPLVLCLVPLA